MVTPKRIIIALLSVIIGIFVAARLFPNEEKKVKKQFALLARCVSKETGENPITTVTKLQKLRALLAENCTLKTHIEWFSGNFSAEETASLIARARLEVFSLSVKFYDLQIEFPEEELARATLTASVKGRLTDGSLIDEMHELECVLKKVEKRWLFRDCEVVEVLKR